MEGIVFATQSNGKVEFKSLEKRKRVKNDLVLKGSDLTIDGRFLEGQGDLQGWTVAYDKINNRALLVQGVDETVFTHMKFLQGANPTLKFRSAAVVSAITQAGLNTEEPFTLTEVETVLPGAKTYQIGNVVEASAPITVEANEISIPEPQAEVDQFASVGVEETPAPVESSEELL